MLDSFTLTFCFSSVDVILALILLLATKFQTNYPGFHHWSISLLLFALSNIFLLISLLFPSEGVIILGYLLFLLALLTMGDSLYRFYHNEGFPHWMYGVICVSGGFFMLFALLEYAVLSVSFIVGILSILILLGNLRIFYRYGPKGTIPAYGIPGFLFILVSVLIIQNIVGSLFPDYKDFLIHSGIYPWIYPFGLLSLFCFSMMYTILFFERFSDELQQSTREKARLLEDLDLKNRDLEQVSTSLWTLNRELDQKVHERTKRIHDLLLQKNQFITQIAHDFRTPLTPLIALIPLLKEKCDNDENHDIVNLFEKKVHNMRVMSDQLIKMAHLNNTSSINDYHDIHLLELIHEAIENNSELIREKDIQIEISISDTVTVCVSKLFGLTIFSNVINNAIKYNVPSGWIRISSMESGDQVQISIKDSGIGIDSDTLD